MELEEFYKQVGGNFEDVKRRLLNEEFIRKFVLKFKDDEKNFNKELSGTQLSKRYVESIIKMPYEEFENLDIEDQNKLIEEKIGRKLTFDDRLHIDGIPLDENHIKTIEQVDKQIDKIVHESSAKKLIRKFKKRD